jgi:hypothetical protein
MKALASMIDTVPSMYCTIADVMVNREMFHLHFGMRIPEITAIAARPATPHLPAELPIEGTPERNVLRANIVMTRSGSLRLAQRLASEFGMRLVPITEPAVLPVIPASTPATPKV